MIGRPALYLALPCNKCLAKPGQPCLRPDGTATSRTHHRRTPPATCGTIGGYQRHKKAGEDACAPCLEANRRYMQERRRSKPEVRADDIAALKARHRATKRLIDMHRDEFAELLQQERRTASA